MAVKEVLFRQISLYYSKRKLNVEYLFQVECEDKEGASFFCFSLEKSMHKVCFTRIKEQVGEKRGTTGTDRNVNYLLKNLSTKQQICCQLKTRAL